MGYVKLQVLTFEFCFFSWEELLPNLINCKNVGLTIVSDSRSFYPVTTLPGTTEVLEKNITNDAKVSTRLQIVSLHAFPPFLALHSPSTSKPLDDLKFVVVGKTSKTKAQLTKDIQSLGGAVLSKPDAKTAACISTKGEKWSSCVMNTVCCLCT